MTPDEQPTAPAPTAAQPKRRVAAHRRLRMAAALLAGAAAGGAIAWVLRGPRPASPSTHPEDLVVTTAPGVTVSAVPVSARLRDRRVEEFDISPRGGAVGRIGETLYDLASGEPLTRGGERVVSFAFVDDSLAAGTPSGRLAYWTTGGLQDVGAAPLGTVRLRASEPRGRLLLFGGDRGYGLLTYSRRRGMRPLCGSPEPISSAAGDAQRNVFAVGNSLFELRERARPVLILSLPEPSARIVGLALDRETTYFASQKAVYRLEGALALPLTLGLGGQIRRTEYGLLALDDRTGRLYRLLLKEGSPARPRIRPDPRRAPPPPTPAEPPGTRTEFRTTPVNIREASGPADGAPAGTTGPGESTNGTGTPAPRDRRAPERPPGD